MPQALLAVLPLVIAAGGAAYGAAASEQSSEEAQKAGNKNQEIANRYADLKAQEGRDVRRRLLARSQVIGAQGGADTPVSTQAQIAREIERQSALDVYGIRTQGYNIASQYADVAAQRRAQAIGLAIGGFSSLISQGGGLGGMFSGSGSAMGGTSTPIGAPVAANIA